MSHCRVAGLLAVTVVAACGGSAREPAPEAPAREEPAPVEPTPVIAIAYDTVDAWVITRPGGRRPDAWIGRPPPPPPEPIVPDIVDDGRPLLVIVYDPEVLDRVNWGDVLIPLDRIMAYVGETGEPDGMWPFGDDTDPWVNRLEWAGRDKAHAIVRDTAAALGIKEGDRYWVVGPAGLVEAVLGKARPGVNMCGRPGGVAFTVEGPAAALPVGSYYATDDRAAGSKLRVRPPEDAGPRAPPTTLMALDTDGDGVVDTVLGDGWLRQGRAGGREYLALDLKDGLC